MSSTPRPSPPSRFGNEKPRPTHVRDPSFEALGESVRTLGRLADDGGWALPRQELTGALLKQFLILR